MSKEEVMRAALEEIGELARKIKQASLIYSEETEHDLDTIINLAEQAPRSE